MEATPFPESEGRKIVASARLRLPWGVVRNLPVQAPQRNILPTVSIQCPDFLLKVTVDVTVRDIWYFSVSVTGIPAGSYVWVSGAFASMARSWFAVDNSSGAAGPAVPAPAPTIWRQDDGELGSFVFGYTKKFSGTVTVYGPPAITRGLPDSSHIRSLASLCDVTLRAAGSDFPVHKAVLAASSPVFLTMFTGGFKEAKDEIVDVTVDCSAETFGVFVDFLYGGTLERRSCADLVHLLDLAEQYMVEPLKRQCVFQLLKMGPEDALEVFEASLEKPAFPEEVANKAVDVIVRNWSTVSSSVGWEAFCKANPKVCKTLRAFVANDATRAKETE